ncbi:thioesterase family protein [Geodermatophilus sp. SYSU D00700]
MTPIPAGETVVLDVVVTAAMTVDFDELGPVHPVYATYAMAKHFEEAGRKLLLAHLEPGEAGIGTAVAVEHLAPAWPGDRVRVTASCVEVRGNRLTCALTATGADGTLLGRGTTGQAVLPADVVSARLRRPG